MGQARTLHSFMLKLGVLLLRCLLLLLLLLLLQALVAPALALLPAGGALGSAGFSSGRSLHWPQEQG